MPQTFVLSIVLNHSASDFRTLHPIVSVEKTNWIPIIVFFSRQLSIFSSYRHSMALRLILTLDSGSRLWLWFGFGSGSGYSFDPGLGCGFSAGTGPRFGSDRVLSFISGFVYGCDIVPSHTLSLSPRLYPFFGQRSSCPWSYPCPLSVFLSSCNLGGERKYELIGFHLFIRLIVWSAIPCNISKFVLSWSQVDEGNHPIPSGSTAKWTSNVSNRINSIIMVFAM